MVPDLTGVWLAAATGFALGLQHAADADHVVAVSTIVSRGRRASSAWLVGLFWGLGHGLTLLLVAGGLVALRARLPGALAQGLECAVGFLLVGLGLSAMLGARVRGGLVEHRHEHGHGDGHGHHGGAAHSHAHEHLPSLAALARREDSGRLWRGLGLGMAHGLAGSSALSLALLAAMPGPLEALACILVFGLGTLAGMFLLSIALSWSLARLASVRGLARWLEPAVGLSSALVGATMIAREWPL